MAVPQNLFVYTIVNWAIPPNITSQAYDTVNIYRSSAESTGYTLLGSTPLFVAGVAQTSYTDTGVQLSAKNSYHYMVVFSHSATGLVSTGYLAYKSLTPREQRLVLQLRDSLSRFITNRLADEEVRQYLEQGLNNLNVYSPTTGFDFFSLPQQLEPLVMLGSIIMGVSHNLLGIGFTDITYGDQGFSLTTSRMEKMTATFDKILSAYNNLLAIAKLDYAEGGAGVGTVALPIGMGGNLNRGIMNVFDLLSAVGR